MPSRTASHRAGRRDHAGNIEEILDSKRNTGQRTRVTA